MPQYIPQKTRDKISRTLKNRFKDKKNHPMYGKYHSEESKLKNRKSHLGKKLSKEHKQKLKDAKKEIDFTGKNNPFYGKHHSEESKQKKREANKKRFRDVDERMKSSRPGKLNPRYGKRCAHSKGDYCKDKKNKKIWMRSSYELKFAKWLDENNLHWDYEPKRFYFDECTYTPDFWIEEWKSWVEIKGWFDDISRKKLKLFSEYYANEKLILLTKDKLQNLGIDI